VPLWCLLEVDYINAWLLGCFLHLSLVGPLLRGSSVAVVPVPQTTTSLVAGLSLVVPLLRAVLCDSALIGQCLGQVRMDCCLNRWATLLLFGITAITATLNPLLAWPDCVSDAQGRQAAGC
jgi:hypothetical protein